MGEPHNEAIRQQGNVGADGGLMVCLGVFIKTPQGRFQSVGLQFLAVDMNLDNSSKGMQEKRRKKLF
ncbi:unnamed protein product [Rodentolepis nana]|uniref:Uncharacterized protein n=1 Tax=Rodentolepis nana TaxID=102285 RepID=A0A0R3TWY7_RODNA|nr:unnamed protein product [Rodentolepis nana]